MQRYMLIGRDPVSNSSLQSEFEEFLEYEMEISGRTLYAEVYTQQENPISNSKFAKQVKGISGIP